MNLHARKQMPEGDGGGGGGDGAAKPWHGEFKADAPADFKEWVANKAFADPQAALYSQFNQEKLLGADRAGRTVVLPKDDKDVEGTKALREKLGVPAKPEDYGLTVQEGDKPEVVAKVAGFMHKHGIPKSAAQGLLADIRAENIAIRKAQETEAATKAQGELTALHTEWGTAKDANTALAKRFAGELGLNEADMTTMESALGTAKFMRMMHAGGTKLGEHGTVPRDDKGGGGFGYTQAQAKEQLEAGRVKRSEGKMGEQEWLDLSNSLSPIAYPQKAA